MKHNLNVLVFICMAVATLMIPDLAFAGTGGTALSSVWTTISTFTQGYLGEIIALLIIVGGIAAGITQQRLWPFMTGVVAGVGLYNAPTIIQSLMGGVIH